MFWKLGELSFENIIKLKIVPKIKKRELRIVDKPIEENDPKKTIIILCM